MIFKELDLHDSLQESLAKMGLVTLTEVQEKAIPAIQSGKDVTILSQTGTGKTFSFLIPISDALVKMGWEPRTMAMIAIAPTRELAQQIADEANRLLKELGYRAVAFYGGQNINQQIRELERGCLIAVFTPGRMIDILNRDLLKLNSISYLVIDEADRLFDMGFIDDVKFILNSMANLKQRVLASATLSDEVFELANEYLKEPVKIEVNPETLTVENIQQSLFHLGRDEKDRFLVNYLRNLDFNLVMVFVNTRNRVEHLVNMLNTNGFKAKGLSSSFTQNVRTRLLKEFREEKFNVLVATDVASRGLDIDGVSHVFNYDLPEHVENYVHRIGRTARAGKDGSSVSFCSEYDYDVLHKIENFIEMKIEIGDVQDDMLAEITVIERVASRDRRERGGRSRQSSVRSSAGNRPNRVQNRSSASPARSVKKNSERPERKRRSSQSAARNDNRNRNFYPDDDFMQSIDDEPMVTVYKRGSYIDPVEVQKKLASLPEEGTATGKKDSGVVGFFKKIFGRGLEENKSDDKADNRRDDRKLQNRARPKQQATKHSSNKLENKKRSQSGGESRQTGKLETQRKKPKQDKKGKNKDSGEHKDTPKSSSSKGGASGSASSSKRRSRPRRKPSSGSGSGANASPRNESQETDKKENKPKRKGGSGRSRRYPAKRSQDASKSTENTALTEK